MVWPVRDAHLDRMRLQRTIPASDFSTITVTGATLVGINTGAPVVTEIHALGIAGILIVDTDVIDCVDFDTLSMADPAYEIGVRAIWTADEASPSATDSTNWVYLYDKSNPGDVIVAAATVPDTVAGIDLYAGTAGYKMCRGGRNIIAADTFDYNDRGGMLVHKLTCAVVAHAAASVLFMGLQIDYMPKTLIDSNEGFETFGDGRAAVLGG